jgi:hypothetical protein
VLEGGDAEAAAALAADVTAALSPGDPPLSLSCGAAALRPGARPADLFRAADAAQYAAKRSGPGRVVVAGAGDAAAPPAPDRRAHRDRTSAETRALAERLLAAIDGAPEGERAERLARALDAAT